MLVWIWIALALAAPPAGDPPSPLPPLPARTGAPFDQDEAFRRWATQVSALLEQRIVQWGRLEAVRGPSGRFVILDPDRRARTWGSLALVALPDGVLLADRHDQISARADRIRPSAEMEVLASGEVPFLRASELVLGVSQGAAPHRYSWTLKDERPFLAKSVGYLAEVYFTDFVTLLGNPREDGASPTTHGVIAVVEEPLEKATPTWVTFGAERRSGPDDADVEVRARPRGGDLELVVRVTDDHHQPLKGDAWLRADHLEVWWSTGSGRYLELHQLAVTLPPDTLEAAWLYPEGDRRPTPPVRHEGDTVVVTLPGVPDPFARGIRGTVAFSDVDPSSPKQTLVATSQLKWADAESFGQIVPFTVPWPSPYFCSGAAEQFRVSPKGLHCPAG